MEEISIEDLKELFPIGSMVSYINGKSYAVVTGYDQIEDALFLEVKWIVNFINQPDGGYFWYDFELINPPETSSNNCPRCSSEMIKKQTDQYGLIDKCPNCGYC